MPPSPNGSYGQWPRRRGVTKIHGSECQPRPRRPSPDGLYGRGRRHQAVITDPGSRRDGEHAMSLGRTRSSVISPSPSILRYAIFLLVATNPAFAQRDAKVPDPDPELERRSFKVADGFEVTLFAADPQLAKPIGMNFDARGRL